MKKDQLRKYLNKELGEEKMEDYTSDMLYQKFDADKRQEWSQILEAEHGVKRQAIGAKIFTLKRILAVAASVAVLLVFVLLMKDTLPPEQALAQAYIDELTIMADPSTSRKSDDNVDVTRAQANEAYLKGDYDQVVANFTTLISQGKDDAFDHFYLALSHLKNKPAAPQRAIELLLQLQATPSLFPQEIKWVLGLAYLKDGELDKAQAQLQEIVDKQSYMYESAIELLQELEE